MMEEKVVAGEARPGIELLHMVGAPGYEDEEIIVSNSLSNGLRIEITNEDMDWACFHIHSPATALLIAERLTEWSQRICNPPEVK